MAEEGLGYALWVESSDGGVIAGILSENAIGMDDYIYFKIDDGRVTFVNTNSTFVLVQMPKAESWYEKWLVDVNASPDFTFAGYKDVPLSSWTLEDYLKLEGLPPINVVYGTERTKEVGTVEQLRSGFPDIYESWSKGNDEFGRPAAILGMMERASAFDASAIDGLATSSLNPDLREALITLLGAAVAEERERVSSHLDPAITWSDLSAIAAMALHERLTIDDVVARSYEDRGGNLIELTAVTMAFVAAETGAKPGTAELRFERRAGGAWKLTGFGGQL